MAFQKGNQINKGRKLAEAHKKRISLKLKGGNSTSFKKGQKHSEEWKKNHSLKMNGENNPRWKGGITFLLRRIRSNFLYRQWRSDVFTRDNFRCCFCGLKEQIEADHIKEFIVIIRDNKIESIEDAVACEELWDINNGRTLCKGCHFKVTFKRYE